MSKKIDELISQSLVIEQEILRIDGHTKKGKAEREREREQLQKEADALWAEAKALGKEDVTKRNYENLANAIVQAAVTDYESLISGAITPGAQCNQEEIQRFAEEQTYVTLDISAMLAKVDSIYREKFLPYVREHSLEIAEQWREFDKQKLSMDIRPRRSKHRCPLCGGCLKPLDKKHHYDIGCTGCNLEAYLPVSQSAVSF